VGPVEFLRSAVSLKRLGLGIESWVLLDETGGNNENPEFYIEKLGYAKVNGKWGLAIRAIWGHIQFDGASKSEEWPFGDAPRHIRIKAVAKIPALIEQLNNDAGQMADDILFLSSDVDVLTKAISEVAQAAKPEAKKK
jgi:hypothetical protein